MTIVAIVLLASFLMNPSASVDKEGFITYVVYGPGYGGGWPGYGRGWHPTPWWGYRRPSAPLANWAIAPHTYSVWGRHWYRGPCPGPWCPYY